MDEKIISQSELERIVQQHAKIIISAGFGDSGEAALQGRFEEFRRQWQPSLPDKDYTALFRTYSNWLVAAVSNHYSPGSIVPAPAALAASIQDGDEIVNPDAKPMSAAQFESIIKEARVMAESAASEIASTTRSGGDGEKLLKERLESFLRYAATKKPNEQEGANIIDAYHAALNSALQRELDGGAREKPPSSSNAGCLGVVAFFALTPLTLLLAWALG